MPLHVRTQMFAPHVIPAVAGDLHSMRLQHNVARLNCLPLHRQIRHSGLIRLAISHAVCQRDMSPSAQSLQRPRRMDIQRHRSRQRSLPLLSRNLEHIHHLRIGQLRLCIQRHSVIPHIRHHPVPSRHLPRHNLARDIQHRRPTLDRRTSHHHPRVRRILRIGHHRIEQHIRRSQRELRIRRLHVSFHIQVRDLSFRRPVELQRAMQHHRNRSRPSLSIAFQIQRRKQGSRWLLDRC